MTSCRGNTREFKGTSITYIRLSCMDNFNSFLQSYYKNPLSLLQINQNQFWFCKTNIYAVLEKPQFLWLK